MTAAKGPAEALLLETFGLHLLAYLCAATPEELDLRLVGGDALRVQAEIVLVQYLVPMAQQVATQKGAHPGLPSTLTLEPLGRFNADVGTSHGNALRIAAGGQIAEPLLGSAADEDPIKALLFRLARDAFPLLLTPADDIWGMRHLSFYQHPARSELGAALLNDSQLSRLYPDDDPGIGRRGMMYNSLGRGGSIQSALFGETVINAAWDAATMVANPPTLIDLLRAIDTNVDTIREAIGGGQPMVRALLVFTGLVTANGPIAETPWGKLRPLTEAERAVTPPTLDGSVSGTDRDG